MSESHGTISQRTPTAWPGRLGVRRTAGAAFVTLALALTACGSGSDSTATSTTTATTIAVAATTTLAAAPTATTTTTPVPSTAATAPPSTECPTFNEQPELPVRLCDKGAKVTEVQQALVDQGAEIVVDGYFGAQTNVAVIEFQAANGLVVDGVVGPLTFAKLTEG